MFLWVIRMLWRISTYGLVLVQPSLNVKPLGPRKVEIQMFEVQYSWNPGTVFQNLEGFYIYFQVARQIATRIRGSLSISTRTLISLRSLVNNLQILGN